MIVYWAFAYALIAVAVFFYYAHRAYTNKNRMFMTTSSFVDNIKGLLMGGSSRKAIDQCQRVSSAPISSWVKRLILQDDCPSVRETALEMIDHEAKGLIKRYRFLSNDFLLLCCSYLVIWGAFMIFGGIQNEQVIMIMLCSLASTLLFCSARLYYLRILTLHFTRAPSALRELHEWMR